MKLLTAFLWAVILWVGMTTQALAANAFNVDASGNVSAASLVTLAVSVTGNISTTTINGSVPSFSGSPSWTSIVGVPAGVTNISNSSGSVTATAFTASRFNTTNTNTFVNGGSTAFSGDYTTGLGYQSLLAIVSGTQNTGVGALSLSSATGQRTGANVGVGYASLFTLGFANTISSTKNIGIGAGAGTNLQSGDNNIVIGATQDLFSNAASNQLNIGGAIWGNIGPGVSNTNRIGVNVQSPTTSLEVSGTVSATSLAGTLATAAQGNVTSLGTLTGLTVNGTLTMTGATNTITATNVYAGSVSGTTGTFGSIGSGPLTASGLITAQAGLTVTGAITATTSIQGATISATTALYTAAISASGLANLNTVSSSGFVSNSATYSNYMREGILAITASTPTTAVPLNVATGISLTLTSNTTISFTNPNNAQANVAVMKITQDSTGGRTLTWPAGTRFNSNVTPTLTTTASTFSECTASPVFGSTNILIVCPATGVSN